MERERGGNVEHLIHVGFRGLREAAARIGGEGLQIPTGAFRVQHPKREGRFSGARDTRDPGDFPERNIDINIFEVMDAGSAHLNMIRRSLGLRRV